MPHNMKIAKHLAPGQPAKPVNLSPRAALEWDRIVGELVASGVQVTRAHRRALSSASRLGADFAETWEQIREDGVHLAFYSEAMRLDGLRRDYIKALTRLGINTAFAGVNGESLPDVLNG